MFKEPPTLASPSSSSPSSSSSSLTWIHSSRSRPARATVTQTRLIPKELHEQLQLQSVLTETNGRSPPRARSVFSSLKQTTLNMTKCVKDSKAEIKARNRTDEPTGATSRKNADSKSLAAIQEKISKFQPRIDALLPRMLSSSTAALPSKDSSGTTPRSRGAADAPLSDALAKVSAESKSAATGRGTTLTALVPKSRKAAATAAPVSIADRIPKGSRTKPIPTLANTTAPPSPTAAKQAGNQPEEPITLLSSLPSFSQDVEDLAISNADIRILKKEASDKSDDEPLIDRRRQQPYTTEANATTHTIATVAATEQPIPRTDVPILEAKSYSIITVGSSTSDLSASIIPSIDNDRITHWMGGVKEALGVEHDPLSSKTEKPAVTTAETAERVESTPEPETTTTTLRRKDSVLGKDRENDATRILAKDSLPSAPLVPLFHKDQAVKKDDMASAAPHQGPSQDLNLVDDVSTVLVGGQPTQDSFALQSLPSYYYEKDDKAFLSDSEREEEADEFNSVEHRQPQSRRSPSLPSGLTASCLQELGLEKKRRNSCQGSRSAYQKRRSGVASSLEEEECAYETMILAQGDVFPSSVGEAPASSLLPGSASLSSFDLPDPPQYKYALPDRAARQQQDDDVWDIQQGQEPNPEVNDDDTQEYPQPAEIQDSFSFPLPPSQTSFTDTMKDIYKEEILPIPEGVQVEVKARNVTVTGPRGTLTKNFRHTEMDIVKLDTARIRLVVWHGKRKHVACLRTIRSLINNMIIGVTKGYEYKMRFVYAHFPINVIIADDAQSVEIRNFLGQKIVMKVPMLEGVTVSHSKDQKDEITLVGNDLGNVSQSAASIQQATTVRNKDIRKFLDGIYVSEKGQIKGADDE